LSDIDIEVEGKVEVEGEVGVKGEVNFNIEVRPSLSPSKKEDHNPFALKRVVDDRPHRACLL
jgi:hypothetical protein